MSIIEVKNEEEIFKQKYFIIHDFDQHQNLYDKIKNEEEGSQIISEEEDLIDEKFSQDINEENFFQLKNNNDSAPFNIEIDIRHSNSIKMLKDFPLNNKIDEYFNNNQNNFEQNIIIAIEKETKNDKDDNNNNNLNIECVKKEKEQIFYVNNKILFNPSGKSEIRDIINEIKKPKPKKEKKRNLIMRNQFKITYESKPKVKQKRKTKPDDIRKKIKSRFLKTLKNKINENLVHAKSKLFFNYLPQCFICNVTKKGNDSSILNMTFKELMLTNFLDKSMGTIYLRKEERDTDMKKDKKKYENNVKTINYLEKNQKISEKARFNIIQKMTFIDLFKEYLESKEFDEDILKLKEEEDDEYVKDYIIKAFDFIKYFSQSG